jgi:hypothetical protein
MRTERGCEMTAVIRFLEWLSRVGRAMEAWADGESKTTGGVE